MIKKVHSAEDIKQCLDIRYKVFVIGQQVPLNEEQDGKDIDSTHYLLLKDNQPAGAARIRLLEDYAKIERVAILDEFQGQGFGREIMKFILTDLRNSSLKKSKIKFTNLRHSFL